MFQRRSFARTKLILVTLVSLYLVSLLLISAPPAVAQKASAVLDFTSSTASVRYKTGVTFRLKATVTNSKIEGLDLRVKYGRRGPEKTYSVPIQPASTIDASYTIYRYEGDIVTGMPLLYTWTATTSGGAKTSSATNQVYYEDTRWRWAQFEGNQVTIRWYSGNNEYGTFMFNLSVDALATYQKRYSMVPTSQIYVSIYASDADFFSSVDGQVPAWAGGVTFPDQNEILLIAPNDEYANMYIGYGIPHELAHVLMYQFVGHSIPHWLDEGFAVFNQNRVSPEYYTIVKQAAQTDTLIPFDAISRGFPADADEAKLAYAQSRSFVEFLIVKFGDAAWANLMDQLRRNDISEAMKNTYGLDLAGLDEQWHNYVLGRPTTLPKALLTGPVSPYPPVSKDNPTLITNNFRPEALIFGLAVVLALFSLLLIFSRWRWGRQKQKRAAPPQVPYYNQPQPQTVMANQHPTEQTSYAPPLVTPPPPSDSWQKNGNPQEMDPLDIILSQYRTPKNEGK